MSKARLFAWLNHPLRIKTGARLASSLVIKTLARCVGRIEIHIDLRIIRSSRSKLNMLNLLQRVQGIKNSLIAHWINLECQIWETFLQPNKSKYCLTKSLKKVHFIEFKQTLQILMRRKVHFREPILSSLMVASRVSFQEILAQRNTAARESQNTKVWPATSQFSLPRRNLHLEGLMISTELMIMITRGQICRLRKTNTRETWIRMYNLRLRLTDLERHQVFMNIKATKCSIYPRSNLLVECLILGWTWKFKKINIKTSIIKYKDTLCLLHKKIVVKTLDSST